MHQRPTCMLISSELAIMADWSPAALLTELAATLLDIVDGLDNLSAVMTMIR